jgi:hypothetical protein
MNGRLLAATAATLLLFTLPAQADTKSWAAVKGKLPAGTNIVVSIDVTQIAKTSAYSQVVQAFLDEERDAKAGFEAFKASCGVDITTVVTDVTVAAINDDKDDRALIAIGLNGVDQAKATACMQGLADMDSKGAKLTVKTKGKVTEYGVEGQSKKFYLAWIAKDVIAFTTDPETKGKLEKMLKGKAAKGALKGYLGKTTATSAVFFGVAKQDVIPDVGKMKGGWGTVDLAGGNISVKATLAVDSATAATKLAEMATAQIRQMAGEVQKQMPDFAKAINATTAAASGSEVTVSGSITEKLLVSIIPNLDKIF